MSKAVVVLFATLLVCSLADPLEDIKSIVERDECSVNGLQTIKPKIHNEITILKEDPENMEAKTRLLGLIDDAQAVYDQCGTNKQVQPVLGDAVKAAGMAFLLASNCFKDVGMVLLILDTVIEDPSDKVNDIIVLIIVAILGKQGYNDCEQFIHFIH